MPAYQSIYHPLFETSANRAAREMFLRRKPTHATRTASIELVKNQFKRRAAYIREKKRGTIWHGKRAPVPLRLVRLGLRVFVSKYSPS